MNDIVSIVLPEWGCKVFVPITVKLSTEASVHAQCKLSGCSANADNIQHISSGYNFSTNGTVEYCYKYSGAFPTKVRLNVQMKYSWSYLAMCAVIEFMYSLFKKRNVKGKSKCFLTVQIFLGDQLWEKYEYNVPVTKSTLILNGLAIIDFQEGPKLIFADNVNV